MKKCQPLCDVTLLTNIKSQLRRIFYPVHPHNHTDIRHLMHPHNRTDIRHPMHPHNRTDKRHPMHPHNRTDINNLKQFETI